MTDVQQDQQQPSSAPPTWTPTAPAHAAPARTKWKRSHTAAAVVAVVVGAAVGQALIFGGFTAAAKVAHHDSKPVKAAAPTTFTVHGTLTLIDAENDNSGGTCAGGYDTGYDDIHGGAQVVIYDNAGAMVATGNLDEGTPTPGQYSRVSCDFAYTVTDVPISKVDLYSVEVTSRGKITFTRDDASAVDLSLS